MVVTVMIAVLVILGHPVAAQDKSSAKFEPARACAGCHAREYREWQSSWMSRAFSNPVFQAEYSLMAELAKTERRADPRRCLRCHAPMALITGDVGVHNELSQDGVTCVLCHSVAMIRDREGVGSLGIDPRGVLYGANTKPGLSPHPMAPSEALRDPRLCAACHHDMLPGDIALERTYNEWRSSSYAEAGVVCVDCHMAPTPDADSGRVSHRFAGGHATSPLLPGAAAVTIRAATPKAFEIEVINISVGHHFPTAGAHPNRLVLKVVGFDADEHEIWQEERIYRYTYLNKAGTEVHATEPVASVVDTTLAPQVPRVERIEHDNGVPTGRVVATLNYELVPPTDRGRIGDALYDEHYHPVEIDRAELRLPRL